MVAWCLAGNLSSPIVIIIIDLIINEIIIITCCHDYRILKTIVPYDAIMQISEGYRGLLD